MRRLPADGTPLPHWTVLVKPTTAIPEDDSIPGLATLRRVGLAVLIPALCLGDAAVECLLRGYSKSKRVTLEVRVAGHRFVMKLCREDPAAEAAVYTALAGAPQTDPVVRAPALVAHEPEPHVLVLSWLEGPSARDLLEDGQGARAGELGALWIRRAATLDVKLGPRVGAEQILHRTDKWAAALGAADPALEAPANHLAQTLARTRPVENAPRLVNGKLYARHVLDLGNGVGVIDWDNFGQGPIELDAAMFLATIARTGMGHQEIDAEAARAQETFLARTESLLDARLLAWHRAAALFSLAYARLARPNGDWVQREAALLGEAIRFADTAGSEPRRAA